MGLFLHGYGVIRMVVDGDHLAASSLWLWLAFMAGCLIAAVLPLREEKCISGYDWNYQWSSIMTVSANCAIMPC